MKRLFQLGKTRIPFITSLRAAMLCLSGVLALLFFVKAPPAYAQQVTLVPPFVGTHSETWERFPIQAIPSGTSILGGIATISGPNLEIDGPGMFTLCGHGLYAQPSDGIRLLGAAYPSGPMTISFSQPVSAFGAYWGGVHLQCEGSSIVLTFRDANGNEIGGDSFNYEGNGTLEWHGYTFATPVKTITRDTDFRIGTVTDGLQATVASSGGNSALLSNISTRAFVQTGDNVVIGGLIITGSGQKSVIVRAIGPSLAQHGITNPLRNPTLELHDHTGTVIASNDNWMNAPNRQEIINSGLAPSNNLESAILTSLSPGRYTAIVRGVNNGTGVALMEAYDLNPAAGSKLGNISTRALVQTGNNVMIGGFIITGSAQKRVIVRAIGPSLAQHGITNPLLDPTLELHNGNGAVIASNDNWRDTQQAEIQATGLAPGDDRESAIVRSLTPGSYTAIVRGKNNTIGVALVELYGLN
jgi:hypothetical protein